LENEYGYTQKKEIPEAPPIPETKTIDEKTEVSLFDSVLRALAFIVLAMIAIFMFSKRNYNQTFWESISFSEDGQNNLAKILAGIVIVSCIVYVLKPLLETSGYGLYFWIITIIIFFLLLRLLNKNRTLLNKKDDENT
jgi:general stress protein CsbA